MRRLQSDEAVYGNGNRSVNNIPHSIARRLLDISRKNNEEHTFVLMRYGSERLLYRISQSAYSSMFILKGATLFLLWHGHGYRTTKDIDFLSVGSPDARRLTAIFKELCEPDLSAMDGLVFLPDSVRALSIQNDQEFQGIRITLRTLLERARIDLQVDIGFGDAATPKPEVLTFPTLLDMPAPVITAYQKYSAAAEKFMAMVTLGMENSRMKDFYDLCVMYRTMGFDPAILAASIRAAFKARNNKLPREIPAILTDASLEDRTKTTQWKAFVNRSSLTIPVGEWAEVIQELRKHLTPVMEKLGAEIEENGTV
jgi:hypothetical protein